MLSLNNFTLDCCIIFYVICRIFLSCFCSFAHKFLCFVFFLLLWSVIINWASNNFRLCDQLILGVTLLIVLTHFTNLNSLIFIILISFLLFTIHYFNNLLFMCCCFNVQISTDSHKTTARARTSSFLFLPSSVSPVSEWTSLELEPQPSNVLIYTNKRAKAFERLGCSTQFTLNIVFFELVIFFFASSHVLLVPFHLHGELLCHRSKTMGLIWLCRVMLWAFNSMF